MRCNNWILISLAFQAIFFTGIKGCNNAATVAKRKKRSPVNDPPTLDVIDFFTACEKKKVSSLTFETSSLFVSFSVLQDIWYNATRRTACNGNFDTAYCWKQSVQSLLFRDSIFYQATLECIDEFDKATTPTTLAPPTTTPSITTPLIYTDWFWPQRKKRDIPEKTKKKCKIPNELTSDVKSVPLSKCPATFRDQAFTKCLNSQQSIQTAYCDQFNRARKFDFKLLQPFIETNRTNCEIRMVSDTFYTNTCGFPSKTTTSTTEATLTEYEGGYYPFYPNVPDYYIGVPVPFVPTQPVYDPYGWFPHYGGASYGGAGAGIGGAPGSYGYNYPNTGNGIGNPRIPSYRSTTKPTTTAATTTASPEQSCFALKLQNILDERATLRKPQNSCNKKLIQNTINTLNFTDTVGFCPMLTHKWSFWISTDKPTTGKGDNETLQSIRLKIHPEMFSRYGLCHFPWGVQVRTADDNTPYTATGDLVTVSRFGAFCENSVDDVCRDYKVRFCCARPVRKTTTAKPQTSRNPIIYLE